MYKVDMGILDEVIDDMLEDLPTSEEFDQEHLALLVVIIEDSIRSYVDKSADKYYMELDDYFNGEIKH